MDWKIIGISAVVNTAVTGILSLIFLPLSFLGPLVGGFLASYPSEGFEDYEKMDEKDGAVVGAISGLLGGILIGLLFMLGLGSVNAFIGLNSTVNELNSTLTAGYAVFQVAIIASLILGLIGGVIGVAVKK